MEKRDACADLFDNPRFNLNVRHKLFDKQRLRCIEVCGVKECARRLVKERIDDLKLETEHVGVFFDEASEELEYLEEHEEEVVDLEMRRLQAGFTSIQAFEEAKAKAKAKRLEH